MYAITIPTGGGDMQRVGLPDLCTAIRSKQAGPYRLTLDVIFKTDDIYQQVKASDQIDKEMIAGRYRIQEDQITQLVFYDPGRALKISMIRPKVAGDPGDGDVYGCQQHAPLLGIELDLPADAAIGASS